MQNSNQQDDQYDQDQIDQEYDDSLTDEQREQERKAQIQRRIKARNQFRSPWFILGIIAILFVVIYPRCTYKDNVMKDMERKAQEQAELQKNQPKQNDQISDEQQGMVPKF